MADDRKYSVQQVLCKAFREANDDQIDSRAKSAQQVLNAVFDEANERLNIGLEGGTISGDLTVTGDMVVEGGGALSVDQLLEGDFKISTASATAFVVGDISEPANDIFTVDTSTPEITAGAPIVFSSLGEATRAIDFSSSGLSGAGDYWIYGDEDNYWSAEGQLYLKNA